ncbi:ATP-binding protein [Flocculibacter collagenilyticus]|uniref:ATP-binding protein n=1 Tax=Flocculibacter collagenilyticus TaxID=2744479 RepID=UPI0018F44219|nr:ATP-binding protein [Flocculibacter collagenilyticus]
MSQFELTANSKYLIEIYQKFGSKRLGIGLYLATLFVASIVQLIYLYIAFGYININQIAINLFFLALVIPFFIFGYLNLIKKFIHTVDYINDSSRQEHLLNQNLQDNIYRLNYEIEERKNAFQAKRRAVDELRKEVTERKKMQQELQEQSLLLRSIVDSSPDLFYYRDENGLFASCNRMFEKIIEKSASEILGKRPSEVFADNPAIEAIVNDHEVFSHHVELTMDVEFFTENGSCWFEMRKVPFYDGQGKYIGLLGFGRDITERKLTETKLERAYLEKGRFIATLSHELRTPLNGIVGLARMLLESEMNQEQRSWVNTIFSSAETLGNIFNDIIDLDKLDRSELDISYESVCLTDFINDVFNFGCLVAQQKNLDFKIHREGPLEKFVYLDPTRLRQVLWNLINNAVKFTKQGEIVLTARLIQLGDLPMLDIEISDTGIGIPEHELDNIFELYYKVSAKGQNNALGSGIGLAVSRTLIEKMDGTISVQSRKGEGSCFSISLPVQFAQKEMPALYDGKPLHILLVEDVPLNAQIAIALLEQRHHEVVWAETGEDALAFLETEDDFDLILLDMQLPDMNGSEVAKIIRQESRFDSVAMVALTANVRKADEELKGIDMQGSLAKPLNTAKLDNVLANLFGSSDNHELIVVNSSDIENVEEPVSVYQGHHVEALDATTLAEDTKTELSLLDESAIDDFLVALGKEAFTRSINLFKTLYPAYLKEIENALEQQNAESLTSSAHKLKGAAGSIGLRRIQSIAKEIENTQQYDWQKLPEDIEQLRKHVEYDLLTVFEYCERHR